MPSVHSTPFQAEDYNPEAMNRECSQCFRHREDLWDHHQDHLERGDLVKVPNLDRQAHHHQHLFRLKHNNNKLVLLQWILAALEDVYSDIRMCG